MNRAPLAGQQVWVKHPIPLHYISAIVNWTHVYIAKPQGPAFRCVLSFNKGDKKRHAIVFNVSIGRRRLLLLLAGIHHKA